MQTRVVAYKGENYLQHFLNGKWATIKQTDLPLTMSATAPVTSGSSHDHAACSASGSKQWLSCTASIAFCDQNADRIFEGDVRSVVKLTPYLKSLPKDELFPHEIRGMRWAADIARGKLKIADLTPEQRKDIKRSEGNEYSREGTRAHEFATHIFAGTKTLADIPEEFRPHVGYYVDFCLGLRVSPDEPYFPEARIPYFYDPEAHGTVDFRIIRDDRIIIADLKYGQGDLVDAVENSQCAIYGLSVIDALEASGMYEFDPDTLIEVWIIQPRHHGDFPAKKWELTLADLRAFCEPIRAKHDVIDGAFKAFDAMPEGTEFPYEELGLEFVPSKGACQYCKARNFCPAREEANTSMFAGPDYSGIDLLSGLPDIDEIEGTTTKKEFNSRPAEQKVNLRLGSRAPLPLETLVAIGLNKAAIIEWVGDVWEHVTDFILSGQKHPDLKIVMGNAGDREWVNEEAADAILAKRLKVDQRYSKKLLGPAKIEKLINLKEETPKFRAAFLDLITRTPGRKVVVAADDKREAVPALSDDLEDVEDFPEGME